MYRSITLHFCLFRISHLFKFLKYVNSPTKKHFKFYLYTHVHLPQYHVIGIYNLSATFSLDATRAIVKEDMHPPTEDSTSLEYWPLYAMPSCHYENNSEIHD